MLECPACNKQFDVDIDVLSIHIASHFGEGQDPLAGWTRSSLEQIEDTCTNAVAGSTGTKRKAIVIDDRTPEQDTNELQPVYVSRQPDSDLCFVCGSSIAELSELDQQAHVNACLDMATGENEYQEDEPLEYDVEAISKGKQIGKRLGTVSQNSWKVGDARQKGDLWWSPVDCPLDRLPPNYTPGLIPLLHKTLVASVKQGVTKKAVLCANGICHIKSVRDFDTGWGCGYRNLEMGLTGLLVSCPAYRDVFPSSESSNGTRTPGLRNLQAWIEEAWDAGYDVQGRNQLQGKIIGSKKWIGVSDVYAALSAKGIPSFLHDFPKPTGAKWRSVTTTHAALTEFVKRYFDERVQEYSKEETRNRSAFDVIMSNSILQDAEGAVDISAKLPLLLQHSGHSRTIVGYEINASGDTNLLIFDPARAVPSDLRIAAIQTCRTDMQNAKEGHLAGTELEGVDSAEIKVDRPDALRKDEHMNAKGWVRKKSNRGKIEGKDSAQEVWKDKPVKILNIFRVNLGSLSKNQEYQILRFDGSPIMSDNEKAHSRVVRSTKMI